MGQIFTIMGAVRILLLFVNISRKRREAVDNAFAAVIYEYYKTG